MGATQGPESDTTEIACTSDAGGVITTGGGFSTIFSAPTYQSSAIEGYFNSISSSETPVSGYSTSGRGYPDIAMAGLNYEVVVGGNTYQVFVLFVLSLLTPSHYNFLYRSLVLLLPVLLLLVWCLLSTQQD